MAGSGNKPSRRRRKEARPGEIIEAGLAEFAGKGFAAARLEDVAKRAGISKGTIYLYFDSKEALFEAAARSRAVAMLDRIEAAIESFDGPTPEVLEMIIRMIYRGFIDGDVGPLIRLLVAEGQRSPELVAFYHREAITKGLGILRRVVARGIERGDLRAGPATAEPRVIIGPAIMAAIWRLTFDPIDPLDVDAFVDAHVDLVLHGLEAT